MNLSLIRNTFFFFSFICWQQSYADIPTILADRTRLIVDDNGSKKRGGKVSIEFPENVKLRAQAGQWRRAEASSNIWRSTWDGKAHVPVAAYHGFRIKNLVVEVTFRFGENTKPWHHQCFRIAADYRPNITGHILSAWANTDNDFIETGLLLQHIRKTPDKTILEDLLFDRQPLQLEPFKWHTALLEIVDDEALFCLGGNFGYAQAEHIRMPKNLVSIQTGGTWYEIKRVRIWEATLNSGWSERKASILSNRNPFTPHVHDYVKPD